MIAEGMYYMNAQGDKQVVSREMEIIHSFNAHENPVCAQHCSRLWAVTTKRFLLEEAGFVSCTRWQSGVENMLANMKVERCSCRMFGVEMMR